jgi:hypothetical protein
VTHLEQRTGAMDPGSEISVVASELSGLHKRIKELSTAESVQSLRSHETRLIVNRLVTGRTVLRVRAPQGLHVRAG